GMAQLLTLFGMPSLPIPDNFPGVNLFKFREIDLNVVLPVNGALSLPSIESLAITIGSDESWTPPVPFVTLTNVGTRWVWDYSYYDNDQGVSTKASNVSGSIFGTFVFGNGSSGGDGVLPPFVPSGHSGGEL